MKTHNRQSVSETRRRRAFTLVEMLVAATLILLMMTLFGQIFGLATNSMDLQRAIAENDQQIRTLTTVLRGDLQKRTFRNVVPFFPLESQDDPSTPFQGREGYFYLSLNSAGNSVDNVLQFTVRSTIVDELIDDTPYFGKATQLPGAFLANQNQPEHDDGEINPNGAGTSTAAEVCYFVRSGNLYRRQMLLREPLPASGADTEQPTAGDGTDYFAPTGGPLYPAAKPFWREFDYSAVIRSRTDTGLNGAGFIGLASLNNEIELAPVAYPAAALIQQVPLRGSATPLGQTRYRFGFDPFTGLSREFGDNNGAFFIGRFTHEESSSELFRYPHSPSVVAPSGPTLGSGNPMDAIGTTLTDSDFDGRVDEFENGPRIGEDLLITNVHEFNIEVWDQRLSQFVTVGYGDPTDLPTGDFHAARRLGNGLPGDTRAMTALFAPIGGSNAVFDTWHPNYDFDNEDGNSYDTPNLFDPSDSSTDPDGASPDSARLPGTGPDNPPYRPMTYDPIGFSAPVPPNSSGTGPSWVPGTTYFVDDVVFPPTEDLDFDGILDPGEDLNGNRVLDHGSQVPAHSRAFSYKCLQAGAGANSIAPAWGTTPGQLIRTSDGYIWQVQSNLRPLSAIRITVRFLHRRSGKMRQMTLVQPLVK